MRLSKSLETFTYVVPRLIPPYLTHSRFRFDMIFTILGLVLEIPAILVT